MMMGCPGRLVESDKDGRESLQRHAARGVRWAVTADKRLIGHSIILKKGRHLLLKEEKNRERTKTYIHMRRDKHTHAPERGERRWRRGGGGVRSSWGGRG